MYTAVVFKVFYVHFWYLVSTLFKKSTMSHRSNRRVQEINSE